MTETTAKSGGSGTSTTPVDEEPAKDGSATAGREAAGRPAGTADAPSQPKFTRAPGMAPPPGEPVADSDVPAESKRPAQPANVAKGSATVPVVTKGKGPAPGSPAARTPAGPPKAAGP